MENERRWEQTINMDAKMKNKKKKMVNEEYRLQRTRSTS